MSKRPAAIATLVAALAAAAGLLASTSDGAAKAQRTIGLVVSGAEYDGAFVETGSRAAATALGDRLAITEASDTATVTSAIESLTAQHVAAIAVENDQDDEGVNQALAQARGAGIPTLSFENRYSNSVWVNGSSPAQYARALADALASQMNGRGRFIIVPCRPADPAVGTFLTVIKAYVRHRYPRMRRVGVVYGSSLGNGPRGTLVLRPVLRKHPHLRGLIFLCQSEAITGPPQLIKAHKVGKIFSAGNASFWAPPVADPLLTSVRLGAEELVIPWDPAKLGYLTVWAADHLATGPLAPGTYDVGGPVGTVHYYSNNQELRLGQPLTITKANLDQYVG